MKKVMLCIVALAAMLGTGARAQDLSGNWQGTLKVGKDLRVIFNVYKGEKDGWSAKFYSIDQTPQPIPVNSVTKQGSTVKMTIDMIGGGFEGKLSDDGKTMTGTWTQGQQPFPLVLVRATPETAWEIPEAPKAEKPMAADADPSFDVATIKPNPSGGTSIQQLTLNGRDFVVRNGSFNDLITFAYGIQIKQLVGSPAWADSDRYDIHGIPDLPGQPNMVQARSMVRKLLADRFGLKFHHEKRELSAYVLSGQASEKLTPSKTVQGQLPGFGASPGTGGLTLHLINGTMSDFTDFLQMLVLDKPVVNQTGIAGRFDANVTFTPELYMFNGHAPKLPTSDVPDAPDLFTAIQRQIGLKLTAEKTDVDVIVVDHVDKPSPN
ncbi:MAG: TIGR03435 family protein [Acidobacteriaceae bacterium]